MPPDARGACRCAALARAAASAFGFGQARAARCSGPFGPVVASGAAPAPFVGKEVGLIGVVKPKPAGSPFAT